MFVFTYRETETTIGQTQVFSMSNEMTKIWCIFPPIMQYNDAALNTGWKASNSQWWDHHLIIDSAEFIIQTSTSFSRGRSPALRTAISAGICCILDPQIRNPHSRNHSAYQASPIQLLFSSTTNKSVSLLSSYSICFAHLLSYWSTARQEKEGKGKECMWPQSSQAAFKICS